MTHVYSNQFITFIFTKKALQDAQNFLRYKKCLGIKLF